MGKYNVGYHGPERRSDNLDGIATLTNDDIAVRHEIERFWKDVKSIKVIEKEIFNSLGVPKETFQPK